MRVGKDYKTGIVYLEQFAKYCFTYSMTFRLYLLIRHNDVIVIVIFITRLYCSVVSLLEACFRVSLGVIE